jgi:uncharacterized protein (TIGR03435 family)
MDIRYIAASVALVAAFSAQAQPAPASLLNFEVASVKPAAPCCPPGQWPGNRPGVDRISFRYVSLWYCITYAYGVKSYQLSGPDWLKQVRFDIVAKGHEGTRRDQLPEMMRALLAERFMLQVHHETKEIAGLALLVGKDGPKFTASAPDSGDGQGGAHIAMSSTPEGLQRMDVKGAPMATLATTLTSLLGRPVIDQTGLSGRYDFVLEFSASDAAERRSSGGYNEPPAMPPPPPGAEPGLSVYSSVRQLGLRLDAQKLALDVVVIDHAEKTPSGN